MYDDEHIKKDFGYNKLEGRFKTCVKCRGRSREYKKVYLCAASRSRLSKPIYHCHNCSREARHDRDQAQRHADDPMQSLIVLLLQNPPNKGADVNKTLLYEYTCGLREALLPHLPIPRKLRAGWVGSNPFDIQPRSFARTSATRSAALFVLMAFASSRQVAGSFDTILSSFACFS